MSGLLVPLFLISARFWSTVAGGDTVESLRERVIDPETEFLSERELVDYVNGCQTAWQAEYHTRLGSYSDSLKAGLMGVPYIRPPILARKQLSTTRHLNISIPDRFDARDWWPECRDRIAHIRDQSSCGSCWAVAATEAFSDRICVASRGSIQIDASAGDLMECCKDCGYGCEGGYPFQAWQYFVKSGVVTGGDYKGPGCKPYPFPPCHKNHTHYRGDVCKDGMFHTPKCERKCDAHGYPKQYRNDKIYGGFGPAVTNFVQGAP
ncbi:unnamed protein product, partial [Mesorhabditis spiculigera]